MREGKEDERMGGQLLLQCICYSKSRAEPIHGIHTRGIIHLRRLTSSVVL